MIQANYYKYLDFLEKITEKHKTDMLKKQKQAELDKQLAETK